MIARDRATSPTTSNRVLRGPGRDTTPYRRLLVGLTRTRWSTSNSSRHLPEPSTTACSGVSEIRTGMPGHVDEEDDLTRLWVGVIPVELVARDPIPHPDLPDTVPVSESVAAWAARRSERARERAAL